MIETEKAWLAGFLDGEGCIHISRPNTRKSFYLQVKIGGTVKESIEYVQTIAGGSFRLSSTIKGYRPVWEWAIYGKPAQDLLSEVFPYLKVKQREAFVALQFPVSRKNAWHETPEGKQRGLDPYLKSVQEACWQLVRKLKQGGGDIDPHANEPQANAGAQQRAGGY